MFLHMSEKGSFKDGVLYRCQFMMLFSGSGINHFTSKEVDHESRELRLRLFRRVTGNKNLFVDRALNEKLKRSKGYLTPLQRRKRQGCLCRRQIHPHLRVCRKLRGRLHMKRKVQAKDSSPPRSLSEEETVPRLRLHALWPPRSQARKSNPI